MLAAAWPATRAAPRVRFALCNPACFQTSWQLCCAATGRKPPSHLAATRPPRPPTLQPVGAAPLVAAASKSSGQAAASNSTAPGKTSFTCGGGRCGVGTGQLGSLASFGARAAAGLARSHLGLIGLLQAVQPARLAVRCSLASMGQLVPQVGRQVPRHFSVQRWARLSCTSSCSPIGAVHAFVKLEGGATGLEAGRAGPGRLAAEFTDRTRQRGVQRPAEGGRRLHWEITQDMQVMWAL